MAPKHDKPTMSKYDAELPPSGTVCLRQFLSLYHQQPSGFSMSALGSALKVVVGAAVITNALGFGMTLRILDVDLLTCRAWANPQGAAHNTAAITKNQRIPLLFFIARSSLCGGRGTFPYKIAKLISSEAPSVSRLIISAIPLQSLATLQLSILFSSRYRGFFNSSPSGSI
jgi:hypothetical protein